MGKGGGEGGGEGGVGKGATRNSTMSLPPGSIINQNRNDNCPHLSFIWIHFCTDVQFC